MSQIEWGPSKIRQYQKIAQELEEIGITDFDYVSDVMTEEHFRLLCDKIDQSNAYLRDHRHQVYKNFLKRNNLKVTCQQITKLLCLYDFWEENLIKDSLGRIADPENYRLVKSSDGFTDSYKDRRIRELFENYYSKEELKLTVISKINFNSPSAVLFTVLAGTAGITALTFFLSFALMLLGMIL